MHRRSKSKLKVLFMSAMMLAKTVHLLALLGLLWASFQKNRLLSPQILSQPELSRVRRFDKLSAATSGLMLLSGAAMLFWLAKPTAYYMSHPGFLAKMCLFLLASALIVWTKLSFRRGIASGDAQWLVPARVRWILRMDFVGLLVMGALGSMVARGML